MNSIYFSNILLLKIHHDYSVKNQYRMPIPYPVCAQTNKVYTLKALLDRSKTIKPILQGMLNGNKDFDETLIINTAKELIEIYFPISQQNLEKRKKQKYCYYTPRHYVCSGLLTKQCQNPDCLAENRCKDWADVWDAQNTDYIKKTQLLKELLSLPCSAKPLGDK
jgi:hypothetical protein